MEDRHWQKQKEFFFMYTYSPQPSSGPADKAADRDSTPETNRTRTVGVGM